VLEDFLMDFPGCLIIVTHDRYFMDKLVDHLFVFEGDGKVKDYLGKYSEYRLALKDKEPEDKKVEVKEIKTVETLKVEAPKAKLSYKEKLEFEQLEKDLVTLEQRKEELAEKLNNTSTNHEELLKITQELGDVTTTLEKSTDRWLELSEFA